MKYLSNTYLFVLIVISSSCYNNLNEKKLYQHYSGKEDSLKLVAAKFLLNNIHDHGYYTNAKFEKYHVIFDIVDSIISNNPNLYTRDNRVEFTSIIDNISDSLKSSLGGLDENNLYKVYDKNLITNDFLIENIDLSFKAWDELPWKNQVSFEDFLEYVLPHRIYDEPFENWRLHLYKKYHQLVIENKNSSLKDFTKFLIDSLKVEFPHVFPNVEATRIYPLTLSVEQIEKGRIYSCYQKAFYSAKVFRALGIPSSIDYLPMYGNRDLGHGEIGFPSQIIDKEKLISNINTPFASNDIYGVVSFKGSAEMAEYENDWPREHYIQYVKTLPKIFRYSFSDKINNNNTDVTSSYIACGNFELQLQNSKKYSKSAYASVCVFDNKYWSPLVKKDIASNSLVFKHLGKNVAYLPAIIDGTELIPIGYPFIILNNGNVQTIKPNYSSTINLKLHRKFPYFTHHALRATALKGSEIHASNDPEFRTFEKIYTIDTIPLYNTFLPIRTEKEFRCYRLFVDYNKKRYGLGELGFYKKINNKNLKLNGNFIGSPCNLASRCYDKAFDGDFLTYFEVIKGEFWIGIDLGEGNKSIVNSIQICPQNDKNNIIKGCTYKLLMWDNEWVHIGTKVATTDFIEFSEVPSDGLYLLQNLSEGKEERIFTYENGYQVWW